MAEMEAVAERDGVPIVHWETGRFLAVAVPRARPGGARGGHGDRLLDAAHGGAARARPRDHAGAATRTARAQARDFFERAGVADRVELIEGDARETIEAVHGPDRPAVRGRGEGRVRAATSSSPSRSCPSAPLLVVDNMLMSGEVALPRGAEHPLARRSRWPRRGR